CSKEMPNAERFFKLHRMCSTGQSAPLDMVSAHKWFNIAGTLGMKDAVRLRNAIAAEMSSLEIATRRRLHANGGRRIRGRPRASQHQCKGAFTSRSCACRDNPCSTSTLSHLSVCPRALRPLAVLLANTTGRTLIQLNATYASFRNISDKV